MARALLLIALASLLGGCASFDTEEFFRHKVEVSRDDLDAPPERVVVAKRVAIDLDVVGYEGDAACFLEAIVSGLKAHPGVDLASISYKGLLASRAYPREGTAPGEARVQLRCRPEFGASYWNGVIAFPGMIPFLPIWLGYGWDCRLEVEWEVLRGGETSVGKRRVEVDFREKNARRSALFHLWPSTGFFGTQFVMGLCLSPTFWFYDGEDTTPLLVKALEPRLGWTFAEEIRREVVRRRDGA